MVLDDINFHIPDLVMTNSLKKMKIPQTKIVDLPIQNGGLCSIVFCMLTRSGKKTRWLLRQDQMLTGPADGFGEAVEERQISELEPRIGLVPRLTKRIVMLSPRSSVTCPNWQNNQCRWLFICHQAKKIRGKKNADLFDRIHDD